MNSTHSLPFWLLKYRAFHFETCEMYEVHQITNLDRLDVDKFLLLALTKEGMYELLHTSTSECALMQSTGRRDSTGQEVFQFDVLGIKLGENFMNAIVVQGKNGWEMMWCEQRVRTIRRCGSEPLVPNLELVWKVIGNPFQNPELLPEELTLPNGFDI